MSSPRFSIIPAGAVTDRSLEPRDLQVLCLLGRHTDKAGWCSRSQVRMAREISCSRGTVQNALDRLCTAGWVEKKRTDTEVEEAGKRPSRSYAYRVLLDRDDYAFDGAVGDAESDDDNGYAENASEGVGCQPIGTPPVPAEMAPGCQPSVGTGANTCVSTKNVPLERPPIERERDARARDRKARFIAAFEQRWPTAAVDDRQRTGYAAEALTEDEEKAALDGIAPFLDSLKRHSRKNVPAGWNYLEQKRWTLLEKAAASEATVASQFDIASPEGKAIIGLFEIGGKSDFLRKVAIRNGIIYRRIEVTPQLLALVDLKPRAEWCSITHQQAGAWNDFLKDHFDGWSFSRLVDGSPAPWPWPPRKDGTLSPTGPPGPTAEDLDALANEGQK